MSKDRDIFIHSSSYVDSPSSIGENTKIWHFCHVSKNAKIGKNCKLGQNVFIGENVRIGNNVKIQNNVSVYEGVTIEDDVFVGPSVVFTNVLKPRAEYPARKKFTETLIKNGASIGANATIICGNTVGSYAFVGAGSVVTKNVPRNALAYGNPAVIRGKVCKCLKQLSSRGASTPRGKCEIRYE